MLLTRKLQPNPSRCCCESADHLAFFVGLAKFFSAVSLRTLRAPRLSIRAKVPVDECVAGGRSQLGRVSIEVTRAEQDKEYVFG